MGANKAAMYDLTDAIDVHAHARGHDEEEPMHAAQEASRAGMKAILFKSISPGRPWEVARQLQEDPPLFLSRRRAHLHGRRPRGEVVPERGHRVSRGLLEAGDGKADCLALRGSVLGGARTPTAFRERVS